MCEWKPDFDALNKRVDGIELRMTQVEHDVGKMRTETADGFRQGAETMASINQALSDLAHDFGQRFNNIETTVVAEKVKWGNVLRSIVLWTARLVLAGCAVAMGVTAWRSTLGGG